MDGERKGFTLIEALVAAAIIATLAAIVYPVLAGARDKARRATCQSNLRQLMAAASMYVSDWDGRLYPSGYLWVKDNGKVEMIRFWQMLAPYARNSQVWLCPSMSQGPTEAGAGGMVASYCPLQGNPNWYEVYWLRPGGLQAEGPLASGLGGGVLSGLCASDPRSPPPPAASAYRRPAQVALLTEGMVYEWRPEVTPVVVDGAWVLTGPPGMGMAMVRKPGPYYPHRGGWNVAFLDGHVKWFTPEAFWLTTEDDPAAALPGHPECRGRRFKWWAGVF